MREPSEGGNEIKGDQVGVGMGVGSLQRQERKSESEKKVLRKGKNNWRQEMGQ